MHVLVTAQMPPPVNGLSAANLAVVTGILEAARATVVNLSPAGGRSRTTRTASRCWRVLTATAAIVHGRKRGSRTLYMPCDGGMGLLFNVWLAMIARVFRYRAVVHHHSYAYINNFSWLMHALILALPRNSAHVVLCEQMGGGLRLQYPAAWRASRPHCITLSNAFIVDFPPVCSRDRSDELTLCHLSNLTAAKGTPAVIALFDRLRDAGVPVRMKLGGPICDEPTREAIELAERRHVGAFEWVGPVYGQDKVDFLSSADIFVFPTSYANEAQPIVLYEALASGLPLLTIARGCIGCDFDASVGLVAADLTTFLESAATWITGVASDWERLATYKAEARQRALAEREKALAQLESVVRAICNDTPTQAQLA